jgi:L-lactate dehydrogenase complex protein LldG
MSREAILGAIRRRSPAPPAAAGPPAPLPEVPDLIDAFTRSVEALGGSVRVPAPERAIETVLELIPPGARILSWSPSELGLEGLAEALERAGVERLDPVVPGAGPGRLERLSQLEGAAVGLTGALAGIAETGTLLLASGSGRSRLAWLLPPHHVALLSRSRLLPTLEAALESRPGLWTAGAGVALVTGPSRSGDIELVLTRGVHGPGELTVVVIP